MTTLQSELTSSTQLREKLADRRQRVIRAVIASRVDIALVCAITILAAAIRLWHLGSAPLGLHGDEALTGIDARRVLHEGWIDPYVISALGQPTGPLYFTALLFRFMPENTFTIRFSMALLAIATIPLAYAAFATMFDRTISAFATLLLAIMTWHLHLSRTGFMVSAWPFIEMAVLWALFAGLKRRSVLLLCAAGVLAGAGVYTYNAYLLFLPLLAVPFVWEFFHRRTREDQAYLVGGALLFAALALFVATPLIAYAYEHGETYRLHEKRVGVTYTQQWKDAGTGEKLHILVDRADEWARGMAEGDRPDLGDGLAAREHPVLDPLTVVLALIGVVFAIVNWRRSEYVVVIAAFLILPLGAILTIEDGLFRRTFGLAPFVAVAAAFPLAWAWRWMGQQQGRSRYAFGGLVGLALLVTGVHNIYDYFGPVQRTDTMRYVYPYQEDAASRYIATLPGGTLVYFYSDRWSIDYETREFIAPDVVGLDRSYEFRNLGGSDEATPLELERDTTRDVAYVFLGAYLDVLDDVTNRYPGGTLTENKRGAETTYRAYFLPRE